MAFGKKTAADILSQKQNRPAAYNQQFDEAVSLVTNTIDNLGAISHNIAQTMQEIEDYERELATTKEGLAMDSLCIPWHRYDKSTKSSSPFHHRDGKTGSQSIFQGINTLCALHKLAPDNESHH